MKLRSSWPAVVSTIRSIRGRGKLSFGQAQLTSVKSMQSRHLPFAFLTRTTLANQLGYSTSRIALAWRSLLTSSLITFCLFGAKILSFLFDEFEGGVYVKLVCDYCGINSPHILLFPDEYFYILF